jgi:hypothetical protein
MFQKIVHTLRQNFEQATRKSEKPAIIDHLEKNLAIANESDDQYDKASTFVSLGGIYLILGKEPRGKI